MHSKKLTAVWEAALDLHGGLRGASWSGRRSERCMVIWEAVLDLNGGLRVASWSGRRYERCMVIWEAVLDLNGGLRSARRSGKRSERCMVIRETVFRPRPLSSAAATFLAGANQIRLACWRADQNLAGGSGRLFRRRRQRRNSARPREWMHVTLLVSLSMEHVVSTARVVTM